MKKLNIKNINSVKYWSKNPTTTEFGLRQQLYLSLAKKGNRIVDLGCGQSSFLDRTRKNFRESWGVDFSPVTIEDCRKMYPKVNYILGSATDTPFKDNYFDVAVAGEVIEHLQKPQELLNEMMRISKKLILSTAKMEYKEKEHLWEFNEGDFERMLGKWGDVETERIKSIRFPGRSYLFVVCTKL